MTPENKELPPAIASRPGQTAARAERGVLCAKCNHLNKPGSTKCDRCESHLHIKCNDCGATNERVYSKCRECGRRLHKSTLEKARARIMKRGGAKVTPIQFVLVLVTVGILLALAHFLNNLRLPPR